MLGAFQLTRRGHHFNEAAEVSAYLAVPNHIPGPGPSMKFVVSSMADPTFSDDTGAVSELMQGSQPSRSVLITRGKRKGFLLDLDERLPKKKLKNTADPDYCSKSHPYFTLEASALPVDTPEALLYSAQSAFSCSIKLKTQRNYASGVNHLVKCQEMVGRVFNFPLSQSDKLTFTSYLFSQAEC